MFILYLKTYVKNIIVFSVISIIFALVFSLYNLILEPVLYSVVLSSIFVLIFIIFHFIIFRKRHNHLSETLLTITKKDPFFPDTNNILEKDYQNLINKLLINKKNLIFQFDNEKSDIIDYFTIWAHQIKTPISGVKLMLQTDEHLNKSDVSIELFKIEQYVDMVLQYLRLNSITTDFVFKEYELDNIIKNSIRKYSKIFIGKKLKLNYSDVNTKVLTDKKWLQFVIEQLISNALKYTSEGSISIYLENKPFTTLVIEDTGIGICPEDIPRIFDKGYTGYNGRLDKRSTGIGLYLCKSILTKISHEIVIESEVGIGTKAKIVFMKKDILIE